MVERDSTNGLTRESRMHIYFVSDYRHLLNYNFRCIPAMFHRFTDEIYMHTHEFFSPQEWRKTSSFNASAKFVSISVLHFKR